MNPNEISKLKEKAPFPLLVLLVLLLLPSFLFQPEGEKLQANISQYDSLLKKGRESIKKRSVIKMANQKLESLKASLKNVNNQLLKPSILPQVIDTINMVAESNSVLLESVDYKFNEGFDGLGIPCFSITMNLDAYYEDMRRFIAEIENLKYPLVVAEIVATAGKNYTVILRQLVK